MSPRRAATSGERKPNGSSSAKDKGHLRWNGSETDFPAIFAGLAETTVFMELVRDLRRNAGGGEIDLATERSGEILGTGFFPIALMVTSR